MLQEVAFDKLPQKPPTGVSGHFMGRKTCLLEMIILKSSGLCCLIPECQKAHLVLFRLNKQSEASLVLPENAFAKVNRGVSQFLQHFRLLKLVSEGMPWGRSSRADRRGSAVAQQEFVRGGPSAGTGKDSHTLFPFALPSAVAGSEKSRSCPQPWADWN